MEIQERITKKEVQIMEYKSTSKIFGNKEKASHSFF